MACSVLMEKTLEVNIYGVTRRIREQRIFPNIKLTCNGIWTKWIMREETGSLLGAEIQTWRMRGNIQQSWLQCPDSDNDHVYEYTLPTLHWSSRRETYWGGKVEFFWECTTRRLLVLRTITILMKWIETHQILWLRLFLSLVIMTIFWWQWRLVSSIATIIAYSSYSTDVHMHSHPNQQYI